MDILGTFVEEDPSTNSILKKLDSDSESDMSKSSDEASSDSASDNEVLAGAITAAEAEEMEKGSEVLNKVVDRLLEHGADLEAPDAVGRTPWLQL